MLPKYNEYVAATVVGDVPVKVVGDYYRKGGMDNWILTLIGVVEFDYKGAHVHEVVFFDNDGSMFWANNRLSDNVLEIEFKSRAALLGTGEPRWRKPKPLPYQNSAMV